MKFPITTPVVYKDGPMRGVVIDTAPPACSLVTEPWYEVQWIDGNIEIHPESHLGYLEAANDEVY